ncbi:MAG: Dolichol-phosphate mannosyltransferase [Candidatus Magasanikbacteria bacterium GW2011_GWC2_40_17]|uniref:Dolichol-phosphate mannosyltransferase n=1 Tax=Candidatus Magasanikbacteria bacterium GW2011_GWA2_42_32 TaxID=1619039 RepID=A0A0G1D5Q9_9BACT|nr:MAG: Dolichol-phosphate mannosyltransferase [Candidatus Magasanikbacteria bacterium GW2011_GWC2_40_17]KKS57393.1 MAG: Dolichol-phosphate mannosyltransferase [Candidatus Magasanikbacteria bacterium GW2011_GWA2_42_32]
MTYLSIIIPVYNEEESLKLLYEQIKKVCSNLSKNYEIIFIDDGSQDGGYKLLKEIALKDSMVKLVKFRRNFGQTAAISAGIDASQGEIIIPLDADLQNDPADIPKLLEKLNEDFDVVSGWRKNRQDKFLSRKLPSHLANFLISFITKVKLHDYGCTLKAYRSEILKDLRIYGEMHRFIPAYAAWRGAQVTEIVVDHHSRKFGKTKYGISRTLKVILDLLVVKFVIDYSTKSIYFFGGLGLTSVFFGFISGLIAVYFKLFEGRSFISTPLPLLTALLFLVGIQLIMMGLLSDMILRSYYETNDKKNYTVKERINF